MDVAQRCEFVFGLAVEASTWHAAGDKERRRLVEERFGEVHLPQVLARSTVVGQLISGEPPAV